MNLSIKADDKSTTQFYSTTVSLSEAGSMLLKYIFFEGPAHDKKARPGSTEVEIYFFGWQCLMFRKEDKTITILVFLNQHRS